MRRRGAQTLQGRPEGACKPHESCGLLVPIPAGSDLARTSHYLDVSISDVAANAATDDSYGFGVRDFASGPPLGGSLQMVFLDFSRDRSGGSDTDFLEDLREYGLSSVATPQGQSFEQQMRDWVVAEILERVHPYYGRNPDGSPGLNAVNIQFVDTQPGGPHTLLCVGGESLQGTSVLGSVTFDENNLDTEDSQCGGQPIFGVFPQAIDNLWGSEADYHAVFDPVDPGEGGVAAGEDPLDPVVLDPLFDPDTATSALLARWREIETAVETFAQLLATATAHETGHYLGLTAPGAAPAGLFGGESGPNLEHNVKASMVGVPAENYVMNRGGTFTFAEMTGFGGEPLPVLRGMNWAYLRDRVAPNDHVKGLFAAPGLHSVSPNPAVLPGSGSVTLTFCGENFFDDADPDTPPPRVFLEDATNSFEVPAIALIADSDCETSDPELETRATGMINNSNVIPGTYDVRYESPDDQTVTLVSGLVVQ